MQPLLINECYGCVCIDPVPGSTLGLRPGPVGSDGWGNGKEVQEKPVWEMGL